jgi:Methyltransferase domain
LGQCRNCGTGKTRDLGFIGDVAPFFLKRVLQLEYGYAPSGRLLKRFLRGIGPLARVFEKIYAKSILVEMEVCPSCSFIQTKLPFQEDALGNLYVDYRSESYNRERIQYEPEYASIAAQVGASDQEVQTRKGGLTRWLTGKLDQELDFSMLDFGGATGTFLPDLRGHKFVFDISNVAPDEGIARIKDESALGFYSYVQLAHVLEHVPVPLALTAKAASFLKPSGYLYIEVPQDLDEDAFNRLANGDKTVRLAVHEHINQYFVSSLTALICAAGLSVVAVESEQVNLGWTKGTIIRALGRKC